MNLSGTPQLSNSGGSTVTSFNATLPTGTSVGDLILLAVSANTSGTGVDPAQSVAGFTAVPGGTSGKTGTPYHRLSLFYRVIQAGDGATAAGTLAAAGNAECLAAAYSGVDGTTPFVSGEILAQPQSASSTSWNTGSITTLGPRWVVAIFGNRSNGTWSALTDTVRGTGIIASSANIAFEDSNGNLFAGTYSRTATYSTATSVGNTIIVALNPASGASVSGTAAITVTGTGTATASVAGTAAITITGTTNPATANVSGTGSISISSSGAVSASVTGTGSITLTGVGSTAISRAVTSAATVYVAHHACFASTLGEGTLEAYQAAVAQDPYCLIELPLWKTTDGKYVISHDRTTGRVFTGTSVDITTVTWASISGYTTINGGKLIRKLDDITTAFPNGLFVVDNKQDTGASALITTLDSLCQGRWMGKQAQSASGTWLTSCQNAGAPVWGFFYLVDETTTNFNNYAANLSNSKSPVLVGLGDFSAAPVPVQADSNTFFSWATTNGFRAWAHILQTTAQKTNADSQASTAGAVYSGYMVSGFSTVAPTYVSGSAQLSIVQTGAVAAVVSGSASVGISSAPTAITVSVSGTALLTLDGTGVIAGLQSAYLYSPPTWNNVGIFAGSVTYKIPTSTTTFKLNGQWHNVQSPGIGVTDGADYIFPTPTEIPASLAQEMIAANVPGTFS